MAKKSPCSKGADAKDLERGKQLETRSSGGGYSQKDKLKTGHAAIGTYLRRIGAQETETCQWCSAPRESVNHLLFECRNWRKERKRMYETFSRNKVLTPRPLEEAPDIRIFGMKEASKGLLQFLREIQVGLAGNEASAQARGPRIWIRRKGSDPNLY
jgi:hypothetical protein